MVLPETIENRRDTQLADLDMLSVRLLAEVIFLSNDNRPFSALGQANLNVPKREHFCHPLIPTMSRHRKKAKPLKRLNVSE